MSAVPDKVLNWLYSVLTSEYHDVRRTYADVAEALSHFPSLSPRTEVYTYENGASALLLLVSGTIPVQFRGATYRFPIALWIPYAYPRESPLVYVTPAQDMLVRPGQHVSGDGKVYHPYLAQWAKYCDKSSILDFLAILRGVFAKEPPVISKQQIQQQAVQPLPPPVPPPPEEWRRSQYPSQQSPAGVEASRPPPVPPKGSDGLRSAASSMYIRPMPNQNGPPLPPLPTVQVPNPIYQPQQWQNAQAGAQHDGGMPQHLPQTQVRAEGGFPLQQPQMPQQQPPYHDTQSPFSSTTTAEIPHRSFLPPQQQSARAPNYQQPQPTPRQYQPPPPHSIQHNQPQQIQPRRPAEPAIDLLSSPLDVTLPSQTGDQTPLPAPPIPPNPEKDAILNALSQALVSQTRQVLESNASASSALLAQQSALRTAQATLQAELDQLQQLDAALSSNEQILAEAMRQADQVMRDASGRRRPEVDEVLVCPTVVGGQLYGLVAEEKACEEARLALGRALDRGRIGVEVFVKQVRGIAREEFLKKVLIRKAGRGMGLDVEEVR